MDPLEFNHGLVTELGNLLNESRASTAGSFFNASSFDNRTLEKALETLEGVNSKLVGKIILVKERIEQYENCTNEFTEEQRVIADKTIKTLVAISESNELMKLC